MWMTPGVCEVHGCSCVCTGTGICVVCVCTCLCACMCMHICHCSVTPQKSILAAWFALFFLFFRDFCPLTNPYLLSIPTYVKIDFCFTKMWSLRHFYMSEHNFHLIFLFLILCSCECSAVYVLMVSAVFMAPGLLCLKWQGPYEQPFVHIKPVSAVAQLSGSFYCPYLVGSCWSTY